MREYTTRLATVVAAAATAIAWLAASSALAADTPFESPFVSVAERVLPAVVSISTQLETSSASRGKARGSRSGVVEDLFPSTDWEASPASGSGFVFDASGLVVTNNHVIAEAGRIFVVLAGEERYPAEIVGIDTGTDVAVLRFTPNRPVPAVEWGDSDAIRVGDWAIAIGNPFGRLEGSVTVGVVSAKGRANIDVEGAMPALQDFIQTDASINFGNSGGPLVDSRGRVIGMNTAISPNGQGIGFAIPAGLLRRTVDQLVREGRVTRGFLGIYPQELTAELAEGKGLAGVKGVLVGQVLRDTPAARAGLARGDVITRIGEKPVTGMSAFRILIAESPPAIPVPFTIRRGARTLTLRVVLADRSDQVRVMSREPLLRSSTDSWLGMSVAELTPELRESWDLGALESGIVITGVAHGSAAEKAGVEPGAIVQEIGDRVIRNTRDFRSAITAPRAAGSPVVLLLKRDGLTRFVAVRLDE
ncbi:MAG: trypsin-like peptidase domain-containing protein [bacterium]